MLTDILRRLILGKKGNISFEKVEKDTGIYIYIPFCKTICPYCSYNKIVYKKDLAEEYKKALLKELILYKEKIKNKLYLYRWRNPYTFS